jgi:hypothetical protein
LVAAAAYMAQIERLYAVDSAVAVDDGNHGGGGRGGEAGAPGGDGIARVNGQAAVTAAAVEEEEEEGAADRDGDRVANGDGGPVAHSDGEDSDGSAAPCSGRMTTTTASTNVGGGAAAIVRRVFSAAVVVVVVVVVVAYGAICGWEMAITTTMATTSDGDDPHRRSSWRPTPLPWLSPSSLQSSVRDLVRSALGRMPFFPGIGAVSPTTRAIILITLSYIALLPSHEIESSSSLIEPSDGAPAQTRSIADLHPPSPNTWKTDARLWCGTSPCSL